jgi:hypothetical protein
MGYKGLSASVVPVSFLPEKVSRMNGGFNSKDWTRDFTRLFAVLPAEEATHFTQAGVILIPNNSLSPRPQTSNSASYPQCATPRIMLCYPGFVTSPTLLLLMVEGANQMPKLTGGETPLMSTRQACSRYGQIAAELTYHGRRYYQSIWRSFLSQGSHRCRFCRRI